jgi:hypothetical protein
VKNRSWGSKRDIGYKGEDLVASLLLGAIHLNADKDAWQKWDVEWNGIKLDVKTTTQTSDVPVYMGFNTEEDLIFVCTNLSDRANIRFHLRHSRQGWKSTFTHEPPLTIEELPQAITDCHKYYTKMYNKTVDTLHI